MGLLREGTFVVIKEKGVPDGSRIFCSSFINELKRAGEGLRKKSHLVAQTYKDKGATTIETKDPTGKDSDPRRRDLHSNISRRVFLKMTRCERQVGPCIMKLSDAR